MSKYLHLVFGEIGGVGKSWFCKMLVEAYISLTLDYSVVDCDETTPNVGRAYDPANYDPATIADYRSRVLQVEAELKPLFDEVVATAQVLENAPKLMKKAQLNYNNEKNDETQAALALVTNAEPIHKAAVEAYEKAKREKMPIPPRKPIYFMSETMDDRDLPSTMISIAMKKDTIVNLPAQVTKLVNSWMEDSGLLSMSEYGLETICWFVGKPIKASIEQLRSLHAIHEGRLKIVLVKNNFVGHAGSWGEVLDDVTTSFIKTAGIISIDILDLRLNDEQRMLIDQEYATFSGLVDKDDTRLLFHEKMKIRQYLQRTIATIVGTGLLPVVEEPVAAVKSASKKKKSPDEFTGEIP